MASLNEIALGVATVLIHSPSPEPMPMDLWGQTAEEAVALISAVIRECADADRPLALVRIDSGLPAVLEANGTGPFTVCGGVPIETVDGLDRRVEFYRHMPT